MTADARLLFATRIARMFGYGLLSVVLVLYLVALGIGGVQVGLILTLTLLGDAAISLWLTTHADRVGRRRILLAGSALMLLAGVVFAVARDPWILLLAATIGVISPSGNEVGPFLAVEQASLSQTLPDSERTRIFGWYNLAGSLATATGALAAGFIAQHDPGGRCQRRSTRTGRSWSATRWSVSRWRSSSGDSRRRSRCPPRRPPRSRRRLGLHRSRGIVLRLVGALLARRVRRRLRDAEPHRLLVPRPLRRRSGHPRRHLLRGEHPGRLLGAAPRRGSPRASA